MGNGTSISSSGDWVHTFHDIKIQHDLAYAAIDRAINLDEQGKPQEALEKYKEGIQLIDSALKVQVTCPEEPDFSWEKACVMIQKMKKTRAEILSRITAIQGNSTPPEPMEEPPSYEEAMSTSLTDDTSAPRTYNDLAQALNDLSIDPNIEMEAGLIFQYEGVKVYFISPNGEVSSSLKPQTLRITLVENEGPNMPRAILQVGQWVYPLIPGVSPCYRSAEHGAFILPNVYAEIPGSALGIILPSDADEVAYELLESILYGIVGKATVPPTKVPEEPEDLSRKISSGIITGASYLSKGLVFGAEKVGNLMNNSTPKIINKMGNSQQRTEVPRGVTKTMQVAENVTGTTARVTGFVADKIGCATMKLGKFLAPHIQKQGTRLLSAGFNMSEETASKKVEGVLTVASGAVEGFATVYKGLESSAVILGTSLRDNTVKVVQHKYGQDASEVVGDTFNTAGNVYHISRNVKIFRPNTLAKRTVKEAGKAVCYQYKMTPNDGAGPSTSTSSFQDMDEEPIYSNIPHSSSSEVHKYDDLPPKKM